MRARRLQTVCVACAVVVAVQSRADAQAGADPATAARIHVGPLAASPTLSLLNVGRDSNVFNEARTPKSDITASLTPSVDVWLRAGRAQLSGSSRVDAVLYKQYSDQSTVGTVNTARLDVALDRLRPYASASFLRMKDRPDAVIDARVLRFEQAALIGVAVTLAPKTAGSVYLERSAVSFADTGSVVAPVLRRELNRTRQVLGGAIEHQLTALTRARIDIQQEQVRFKYVAGRDAQGIRVTPAVDFKPRALVSGQVRVGVLSYQPADPRVPRFTGPIAAVAVRTIVGGRNEIVAGINRDLSYSADALVYYVQTQINGGVTRQLNDQWTVSASLSRQAIAYSAGGASELVPLIPPSTPADAANPDGIAALLSSRPDTVLAGALGLGYRFTGRSRAGVTVSFIHRDALLESGRYDNLRVLGSMTYGAR